jgi:hypothetical protein
MLIVLIVVILLAIAVGVIYWLLKSMGEDGIEAAAPGSCKSGRCGVRRAGAAEASSDQDEGSPDKNDEPPNSRSITRH